ncbi:5-formyltetrahydrofolate cyclo-ligase [Oerskovia enterophila]|uniref:5-formyltetrahydrofolate cyclo-ligase n=1 Tax=Oerskovia enterophila TaxID=43678 RepID=UPI003822ED6A
MSGPVQPYPLHGSIEPEDAKEILRKAIRTARSTRSERRRDEAALLIADVIETIPEVLSARCVATYAARPTEPGTTAMLDRLAARGVRVLLPVLGAGLQRDWAEYAGSHDLRERAPGRPPEPSGPALGAAALVDADVVIAPALAVDTRGVRLGQGGGWYDRALEHMRPGTKVIAVVFPDEVYDADERPLPLEKHDRTIDGVATPQGWRWLVQD